mgnify:CR=1 FL=1
MKKVKVVALLMTSFMLVGCSNNVVIPEIDVEKIQINLPALPTFNQGEIKTDGTYDYIDLYEVSDFHGAVNFSEEDKTIGLSKLSGLLADHRKDNKGGTVVVSSGDMWQGSAESNLTKGFLVTYAMNYMGFDAMTLGNHEFDWTTEWIKKNKNIANFPFLAANLYQKGTNNLADFVVPSKIIERGDYKIGLIGTMGEGIESSIIKSAFADFELKNEKEVVKSEAQKLRDQGCNIVVWNSHYDETRIATRYGSPKDLGVNVVFGGHSHVNQSHMVDGVPMLQTRNYGRGLAHAQLKIDKASKEVTAVEENCSVIEEPYSLENLHNDSNIDSIKGQYDPEINRIKNIKVGSTDVELKVGSTLGNLCVKSMSEKAIEIVSKEENLKYEVVLALHNLNGGIRSNIDAGDILYGDVYKSFPFDNELVLVEYTGKDLKKALNYQSFNTLGGWHSYKDHRSELKDDKNYYVVTTDFVATSPNFSIKKEESDLIYLGIAVRDIVVNFIATKRNIKGADYLSNSEHPEFRW